MVNFVQDVQQEMAAAACGRHLDLWICIFGTSVSFYLGTVWTRFDDRFMHHHSGQKWQIFQGISIRIRIFITLPGHHSLLCEVS